jgi:hypothetical protein
MTDRGIGWRRRLGDVLGTSWGGSLSILESRIGSYRNALIIPSGVSASRMHVCCLKGEERRPNGSRMGERVYGVCHDESGGEV